ncbi:MAG: LVIVD repeat-containing protein [Mycobacteriales bacterium]
MRTSAVPWRLLAVAALTATALSTGGAGASVVPGPTPGSACGPGSLPEKTQGRAPASDVASGRFAKGYSCNLTQISHVGASGGYRVERYVDKAGHECAYWDSTLLFPTSVPDEKTEGPGVYVMDMTDPAHPVHTDTLRTPAMLSPHESLRLNQKRGLLVADMATPATEPGFVDVYDVTKDCRHPALEASSPVGVLGHEGAFSPDGKTFWVASLYAHTIAAVDLTNPRVPNLLWLSYDYQSHGVSISDDGNTLYMAESGYNDGDFHGLTVLDVRQIQRRLPSPKVPVITRLTWPNVSTPQNATPFVSKGHQYLLETDEFGSDAAIGAARIISIDNIKKPRIVSNIRLAVNQPKIQPEIQADPGNDQPFQGYQAHYCSLPSRIDPTTIACGFIMSGLRVFDIADVRHPREIAYFNKPVVPGSVPNQPKRAGGFAMSAPAYDQQTGDIWFTDGNSGFYVVRLTGTARRGHFAAKTFLPGN